MSSFTVTSVATVTVAAGSSAELVRSDARRKLEQVAYRETYDGVQVTIDSVEVEVAPEPEPTVTMTETALAAHIQACVEEALAAARTA
jgi:hypothetical protein